MKPVLRFGFWFPVLLRTLTTVGATIGESLYGMWRQNDGIRGTIIRRLSRRQEILSLVQTVRPCLVVDVVFVIAIHIQQHYQYSMEQLKLCVLACLNRIRLVSPMLNTSWKTGTYD